MSALIPVRCSTKSYSDHGRRYRRNTDRKVGKLGAEMLVEYLKDPTKYPPVVQPEEASYASKLEKAEGVIDWNQPAQVIVNKIRALIRSRDIFQTR